MIKTAVWCIRALYRKFTALHMQLEIILCTIAGRSLTHKRAEQLNFKENACMAETHSSGSAWAPIWAVTAAAFLFNTSEFVPVGLLSALSAEFGRTEAQTGIIITVYAWLVLLCSLPLILLCSRFNYKALLTALLFIFAAGQTLTALAPDFRVLLGGRCLIALTHALFWSIATPAAVKIAPPGKGSQALGLVAGGTAVAMIAGMPLGRLLGLTMGWRFTFGLLGILALIVGILILRLLPSVPGTKSAVLTVLPRIFKNPALMGVYLVTALTFTGHFIPYSYIEPYWAAAGMPPFIITLALSIFGAAGLICSIVFSRRYDGHEKRFTVLPFAGLTLCLALLQLSAVSVESVFAAALCWGLSFGFFSLTYQALVLKFEPEYAAVATAIYSSICNLGIGAGAFMGGRIIELLSLTAVPYCGAFCALLSLIFALWCWQHFWHARFICIPGPQ